MSAFHELRRLQNAMNIAGLQAIAYAERITRTPGHTETLDLSLFDGVKKVAGRCRLLDSRTSRVGHGERREKIAAGIVSFVVPRIEESGAELRSTRVLMQTTFDPQSSGGEAGIRTLGTLTGTPHFECGAFDHSATSPQRTRRAAASLAKSKTGA